MRLPSQQHSTSCSMHQPARATLVLAPSAGPPQNMESRRWSPSMQLSTSHYCTGLPYEETRWHHVTKRCQRVIIRPVKSGASRAGPAPEHDDIVDVQLLSRDRGGAVAKCQLH